MKPPPPEPAVTALAGEIEQLRRQLDALRREVEQAQRAADTAHRVLVDLTDRIADIATAPIQDRTAQSHVVSWLVIQDRDDAQRELRVLVEWCCAVLRHYPGAVEAMGECWLLHPAAVEELIVSRLAWLDAYTGDGAAPARAMDWHDRHRPGSTGRVAATIGTCTLADHRPGGSADRLPARLVGVGLVDAVAAWSTATHGATAPPARGPDILAEAAGVSR